MRSPFRSAACAPGAVRSPDGAWSFSVWAPAHERIELHLVAPEERRVPLVRGADGVHRARVEGVAARSEYLFALPDGRELPDPASRHQPRGVPGPSALVDTPFAWSDRAFRPVPLQRLVFYELHVGCFTAEGTFDAVIPHLERLVALGVTAVELMPVAQFSGRRNWGYDGVFPYAVQDSYGGPAGLARLVDACHAHGLAVALDVVHNHLGPEGNVLGEYGPYFTDRYRTPWGGALNFDGPGSDEVRRFFLGSALWFLEELHVDVFRVDAVHAIHDASAKPYLAELAEVLHARADELGRAVHVVAESDLNDARVVLPPELGGYGMDAQWSDDFHHALHALLTGEREGYYADFGELGDLAEVLRRGWTYAGRRSRHRGRRHGNSPDRLPAKRFVVAVQNHDQVGNRARGERLAALVDPPRQRLAAAALLLSPFLPLLFMGEEYGETAPFQYFTSHSDPELARAVRRGRRAEFRSFGWAPDEVPDPQDEATWRRSRLDHGLCERPPHRALLELHRELLRLRREHPALRVPDKERTEVVRLERERTLLVRRWCEGAEAALVLAFDERPRELSLALARGRWSVLLDTEEPRWGGARTREPRALDSSGALDVALAPHSCLLLSRDD